MRLFSSSFEHFDSIPIQHTGDGDDVSPPLMWEDIPEETRSFVLICEDPDAPNGTWDHWILYNIPPTLKEFEEGVQNLPEGTLSCKNSWHRFGYGGPNPPSGTHRYFFILYALDTHLELPESATKDNLRELMKNHILAEATLIGRYEKKHNA